MFINFFDAILIAASPDAVLSACKESRPELADSLRLVPRDRPTGADVYAMRGARHTGWAVYDGESYSHIWS